MTESGGPTTQAGIRFQDRVAALYMGRMLDARERPSRDRPVEVQMETQDAVDDFVVRFDDGSRHFFQAKLSLQRKTGVWGDLWQDLYTQFRKGLSPDDRLILMLGEPTALSSALKDLSTRSNSLDAAEWLRSLASRASNSWRMSSLSRFISAA